jgi:hypothetical protein
VRHRLAARDNSEVRVNGMTGRQRSAAARLGPVALVLALVAVLVARESRELAPRPASLAEVAAGDASGHVSVAAPVDGILSSVAFVIGGQGYGSGERILVLGRELEALPAEGDVANVVGQARRLDVEGVEREVGRAVNAPLMRALLARPALVVDSLVLVRRGAPVRAGADASVSAVVGGPARFFGRTVAVSGTVARRVSPAAIVLDGHLLVVGEPAVLARGVVGRRVRIVGNVSAFDRADVEEQLSLDTDGRRFDRFVGQPTLLATTIVAEVKNP